MLGIGTGYLETEFDAVGVDIDERNALFDEALDVLPLDWSARRSAIRGRHFARDVMAPRPAQSDPDLDRRQLQADVAGWRSGRRAGCP